MPEGQDHGAIKFGETTHRAAEDVATFGVLGVVIIFTVDVAVVVTDDSIAADVDSDVATGEASHCVAGVVLVVGTHNAVVGISVGVETVAHRGQTATAVDGTEHGAARDVDGNVASHVAGGQGVATETAAAAEDVAVDI